MHSNRNSFPNIGTNLQVTEYRTYLVTVYSLRNMSADATATDNN